MIKAKKQIPALFLLFLMLVSPFAFAAELKTVKVSDLKPGQIIVDSNGNEIKVESLKTQEKEFTPISEILNQLLTRNPQTLPQDNLVSYVGDSSNGLGISLTGNVVTGMATNQYLEDNYGAKYTITLADEDGNPSEVQDSSGAIYTVSTTNVGEYSVFSSETGFSSTLKLVSSESSYNINEDEAAYFNSHPELVGDNAGTTGLPSPKTGSNKIEYIAGPNEKGLQADLNNKYPEPSIGETGEINGKNYKYSSTGWLEVANSNNFLSIEDAKKSLGSDYQTGQNYIKSSSGAIHKVNSDGTIGDIAGRGTIKTQFGTVGFGKGQLIEGVQWAVIVAGFVQVFGTMAGADPSEINALSMALSAGIIAGKLSYSLLGNGGVNGITSSGSSTANFFGSSYFSAGVGAATAWLIYNAMWSKESTKTEIVNFQCLPWQAPHGGQDCELCNSDSTLPCSEYRCKSLGQSCGIINAGTSSERCVNQNPRDVAPPVIKPFNEALEPSTIKYSDVKENPPGAGFKIKSSETTTGCIKPYSNIEFGIQTNEPAQCKIDYVQGKNYSQMATYFGGTNLYEYNHTESLSLPSADSFKNSSLVLENGKELHLFMKCRDAQGNTNEADYELSICVDPSPDQTPPKVIATSIPSESCVASNAQNSTVLFYMNEPSVCRWSPQDQSFENMKNNMTCASSITEINALQLYPCTTLLTGIAQGGSDFYIRCQDQPGAPENKTNKNVESYKFSLRGSNPLKMGQITPNQTIYGSVNPMPVELSTTTLFGCDSNKAICYYSTTGAENSFIQFFDTNKEDGVHTQRLDLTSGNYNYFVKCVDAGGNVAENLTTFRVDVDPNAPMIARVYEEEGYLKLVTPQDSQCYFTNENCDFLDEGTEMPVANSMTHITPWFSDKTYYIKCKDEFRSLPTDCSLVVKPTDNFL